VGTVPIFFDDTIVAVSTPVGEGGIGIVRMSGPDSLKIADKLFRSADGKKPSKYATHTVHYGRIIDSGRKIVDEVILTVMRAPKSYTKEDIVEINCHGGIQSVRKVFSLAAKSGARLAEPGEFTKRAFLAGRIDLAQAEAVLDVIRSKTEASLKVAVSQLEGSLSKVINGFCDAIVAITAEVEASIDFPEEGIAPAERKLLLSKAREVVRGMESLTASYDEGAVLREGVLAIICGKPNVGKSSLMNLLLKRDRVIVSPIPGTTRDAVEEMINLKGIPIRLVDTAGISDTKDLLEREGVAKSRQYLALADVAIIVLDNSARLDDADLAIIQLLDGKKKIVALNKCDLPKKLDSKKVKALFPGEGGNVIEISVEKKKNIGSLEKAIADAVWSGGFIQGEGAIVSNARHKELLDKALGNMLSVRQALEKGESPEIVSIDLRDAMHYLGLITGRSVSDDVLDRIFEQFCIGK
jgi:tRNA modification GTPase